MLDSVELLVYQAGGTSGQRYPHSGDHTTSPRSFSCLLCPFSLLIG